MSGTRWWSRIYRRYRKTRKVVLYSLLSWQGRLPSVLKPGRKMPVEPLAEDTGDVTVAVCVTGGLGDFLIVARLLRDLCAISSRIKIELFVPTAAPAAWAFEPVSQIKGIYSEMFFHHALPGYDCALVINQMAFYYAEHVKYARIKQRLPQLLQLLETLGKNRGPWEPYIQSHPYLDGAMAHRAVVLGENRYSLLHRLFGLNYGGHLLALRIDESVANTVKDRFSSWITVSNGFDAAFKVRGHRATKCYPQSSWVRVLDIVKRQRPDVGIVQVGGKTSELIRGVDVNLIGKTSLAQAAALIKYGMLHVDNEGGLVHVAASLGRRALVLFGPTSKPYFSYEGNINLDSGFCGGCWWSTRNWMEACPREYETPVCLDRLAPEVVAEQILQALDELEENDSNASEGPSTQRDTAEAGT
ncbi:glycosyltransferase family 9 protein [Solimonas aquatica]|nr:glycosyltransferase family 9 protein [Solimonas aquatica]